MEWWKCMPILTLGTIDAMEFNHFDAYKIELMLLTSVFDAEVQNLKNQQCDGIKPT